MVRDASSTTTATIGAVTDHGNGTYSFPVTAGTTAGDLRLRITANDGTAVVLTPRTEIPVRADALWAQTARLNAARERQAKLAREEAELVTGGKLPAAKRDNRGEVFAQGKGTFGSGKASLSDGAQTTARTIAAYAQASSSPGVRVEVTAADAQLAQRRAEAVRDALVAGGWPQGQVQVTGRAGKGDRAEVVVQSK